MSIWIEIKDGCEMPPEEAYCTIRVKTNNVVGEGFFFMAGTKAIWRFTRWPGEIIKAKDVTHWMPLPAPPENIAK